MLIAVAAACLGGLLARKFKILPLIGYLVAGMFLGSFWPKTPEVVRLADLGLILLLFTLGLEFPLVKIARVLGGIWRATLLQAVGVIPLTFLFLVQTGFSPAAAGIIAFGVFCSSTALVVKILAGRGETETVHGTAMTGWLLLQDLAVIPAVVLISALAPGGVAWFGVFAKALFKIVYVLASVLVFGRLVIPYLMHQVALLNSRELLLLTSLTLAAGVAYLTSLLGVSLSLGAFLAGLVLAESAENHAVFAEIRPLRDVFGAVFFVTLGLVISPGILWSHAAQILLLAGFIVFLKTTVDFGAALLSGFRGKAAVALSLGLSQAGEFLLVVVSLGNSLRLIGDESASVAIAAALLTLLATPFLFKAVVPFWRKLKEVTVKTAWLNHFFTGGSRLPEVSPEMEGHVIICGYGRMGKWVGHALSEAGAPFVVVDYDFRVIKDLKKQGLPAIFGDPAEPEVLAAAGITKAKILVLAMPDRISQEILVGHVQTVAPAVKVISRIHLDEDWQRLKTLRVQKVVQPEFEAAVAVVKTIFTIAGKPKPEIDGRIRKLRLAHTLK